MASRSSSEAGPSNPESGVGTLLANKLPSIRILRPPPSKGSPRVDERCFTYCSQSVGGRINGAEPWCRTICLRKVFEHEMKRHYMSYDPSDTDGVKVVDMKYPLPPEGQKSLRFFPWVSITDHPPHSNNDGTVNNQVQDSGSSNRPTRYWEEGWYMWMSKSRWGAQEKLDLMLQDLEAQTEWYEYKSRAQAAWNKRQEQAPPPSHSGRGPSSGSSPSLPSSPPPPSGSQSGISRQDSRNPPNATELAQHVDAEMILPPPDHVADSLLIHLPPPFEPPFEKALGPAQRVLSKTWKSIEDGHQARLIGRIAEKSITQEPFILAQNVCKKVWELWTQSSGGNEEEK